ncbi:MAG: hypothetical protein R3Y43_07450 [Alphaproteobacteria bacterium]
MPEENTKALEASLKSYLGSSINILKETAFYEGRAYSSNHYEVTRKITNEEHRTIIKAILEYRKPTEKADVVVYLSRLQMICKSESLSNDDLEAKLDLYVQDLCKYPIDILHQVLKETRYEWFPPLGELILECNKYNCERDRLWSKFVAGVDVIKDDQ